MSIALLLVCFPPIGLGQEFRPIFHPPTKSILDALREDKPHFSKLIALIERSGMKELTDQGFDPCPVNKSFTLLAPTDEAFSKVAVATYDPPFRARQFLRAHLLRGRVLFQQGKQVSTSLKTIDGSLLKITFDAQVSEKGAANQPLINGKVRVLGSDAEGACAVIHVVDSVLRR